LNNNVTTLPAIGAAHLGGFYAGQIMIAGVLHGLIVAPKDLGENQRVKWLASEDRVTGADSYFDGMANTMAMAEAGSPLATWARGLDINGHADWYVPSQDELEIVYRSFKPTDDENYLYVRSGVNASAVPPTHAYSATEPAQTQVQAFAAGGEQAFEEEWYWTSTQHAAYDDCAWTQGFYDGLQSYDSMSAGRRARAVRRFAI